MTKEIALIGFGGEVFAHTLSKLLKKGLYVNALVPNPEHMMLEDTRLTVSRLDLFDKLALLQSVQGYKTVVLALETYLTDAETNQLVLGHYNEIINAAIEADVKRLVVVGGKYSEAFYTLDLRRRDNLDWVFISTEGNYPKHAYEQAVSPTVHAAVETA